MNIRFEKDYLIELYTQGKTTDKKHRFQPNVVNGYLKCVKALMKCSTHGRSLSISCSKVRTTNWRQERAFVFKNQ